MKPEQLKKLRNDLGLSVNQAAVQVHIAPRSWARYEAGDRPIPNGIVHLFCLLNDIDAEDHLK